MGPVIRLDTLTLKPHGHCEAFQAEMASLAAPAGAHHLGARLMRVPPGKKAWPFHAHHANDEMFVVLSGSGTLRFGDDRHDFAAGDVLMCPAGGKDTAHQILNTGEEDLTYIAISSMREPDVMEYPDSGKWGAFAGSPPGAKAADRTFSHFVSADAEVEYWEGES